MCAILATNSEEKWLHCQRQETLGRVAQVKPDRGRVFIGSCCKIEFVNVPYLENTRDVHLGTG